MQVAHVLGHATSTVKHATLAGLKLLVVQPLMHDGIAADGAPLVVIDHLGAGRGDRVILTSDGAAIRELFGIAHSPVRWAVLGVVDDD